MPLPAGLLTAVAILALAAPASAADPVSGVLDIVAKTATPAVTQVVPAPAPVAPTPAAAQQAGDVAQGPVPADRMVEHTTSSVTASTAGTMGSEPPAATSRHDPTPAGAATHQPESTPRSEEGPHASGATPSRDLGIGAGAGATTPIVSRERPSGPAGAVVHGVVLAAGEVAPGVHPTGPLSADRPLARQLLDVATAGTGAHPGPPDTVRGLVLATDLLADTRVLGEVGETATRLAQTTPATIIPLLAPLAQTLAPPLLSEPTVLLEPLLATLPALTGPPQSEQSPTPVLTPAASPAASPPIALSLPAAGEGGGGVPPSTVPALQGAWLASSVVQAYVATAKGIGGAKGAPDRPASTTSSAAGAFTRASSRPSWAAGTTASAYGLSTSDGTAPAAPDTAASSGGAYEQPSPAPAPGSTSPATGAVAGTSIPIFLTLAGLLLLAAPCARRVLRLLGETWRLSPLALILERPG